MLIKSYIFSLKRETELKHVINLYMFLTDHNEVYIESEHYLFVFFSGGGTSSRSVV